MPDSPNTVPILIDKLAAEIQRVLASLTPNERVTFWEKVIEGYCPFCGGAEMPCHCDNDE